MPLHARTRRGRRAADSFAYDGHRVRKWNVACHPYGQAWVAGDVITCTIDLTSNPEGGTVSYHRNGMPLGRRSANGGETDRGWRISQP